MTTTPEATGVSTAGVETPAAEPRLTLRHWLPFTASDSMNAYVEVVERVSKKKVIPVTYGVRVAPALCGGTVRVFHVFKQGNNVPRELRVYPRGFTCTCTSGRYRPGRSCRHLEAIQYLTEQGVI